MQPEESSGAAQSPLEAGGSSRGSRAGWNGQSGSGRHSSRTSNTDLFSLLSLPSERLPLLRRGRKRGMGGRIQGVIVRHAINGCISLHDIIPTMQQPQPTMEDLIKGLPLGERVPVAALHALLAQREQLDEQQEIEIQNVHKKYLEKMRPLLERASQLIQGKDPLPAELAELSTFLKPAEKAPAAKGKIIDRYWNAALENSRVAAFITEKDEKALEYLLDVQLIEGAPDNSIALRFLFKPNPYFNETTLVRRCVFVEGKPFATEGDEPTWKGGNWLTHESKKASNKATGLTKAMKGKKIPSFFDVFLNWTVQENTDEFDKAHNIMVELTSVIRDSLSYFLGLFENEDASEEGEEDEDYEEDEEEEEAPRKAKK